MAVILNIDTATEHASVCISKGSEVLAIETSSTQKDHAAFIQPAIQRLVEKAGYSLPQIDAIAVSNGPGSYTGLRVGLSTAKGIAYALDKPLILINTLEVIATAAIADTAKQPELAGAVYCPMIDARRMEVFTAVFDAQLNVMMQPVAMILDENSFASLLESGKVVFNGSGARKFRDVIKDDNAVFIDIQHDAAHMSRISERHFMLKSFADKAYSEPFYLKEFFTPATKLKSD